jgi:large subunit ribosomal protein L15
MQIHNLTPKIKKTKRVGRGGKRGTYSGKGGKGQTARSGHRIRPAIRDYLKQIPKLRGRHKNTFKSAQYKAEGVNLARLEAVFNSKDIVSPKTLREKGLVTAKAAMMRKVKILGDGKLIKKLVFKGCLFSESAKKAVEKAGGTIA